MTEALNLGNKMPRGMEQSKIKDELLSCEDSHKS